MTLKKVVRFLICEIAKRMFLQGSRHSNYSTHFEEAAAAIMVSTASASTFWRQLCVSTTYGTTEVIRIMQQTLCVPYYEKER